ncbi:MAG: alpha/beta hydrolase [Deltaproteobacteria bacterium]|nr:alpha/beta hydrolase [Deltaproteobacteria bacterium]
MIHWLEHYRVRLALHELRPGAGRALLLLHALAARAPERVPPELSAWPGPVYALDFTGHGASTVPKGGGYTCELLISDADHALAKLGSATVAGRGLGAYVALLTAGSRPKQVRGAILLDGPGLAGGSAIPGTPQIHTPDPDAVSPPDPLALIELGTDVRPPDYATAYARQATHLSDLDSPIYVCASERPQWLRAVVEEPGVQESSLEDALAACAKETIRAGCVALLAP